MDRNYERIAMKLQAVEGRYEELGVQLTLPEVTADSARLQRLMREHSELGELAEFARGYRLLMDDAEEAQQMADSDDEGMRELGREELATLEPELEKRTQEARILLLPKDPDDYRNAVLEVRAGAGGDEAGLFGAELLRMYEHYADSQGWKCELIEDGSTELGGIKESTLLISGKGVFSKLKYESGVHRVQRVPVTESGGRIHTSTATVAVLPEAEDVEVEINPNDLKIDTYRAVGRGRTARQPNRLRRAHHAPAHRPGRDQSGSAQPDSEPRKGHAGAQDAPVRPGAAEEAGRVLQRAQEPGGHG